MQTKYPNLKWKEVWQVLYLFEAKKLSTRQARLQLEAFGIESLDATQLVNTTALHGYSPHRYEINWSA